MNDLPQVLAFAGANRPRFVEELRAFIRFPSVSAQPNHAGDVKRCATWLARHLSEIGLQRVNVIPTKGHPLVYGEWLRRPGRPTVLIYGHYDVQPAEPLGEWRIPPFEPTVVGDNIFGRGSADDKGQLFTHVKAIECFLRAAGELPVNVGCLFEGEEEIGSPNFDSFLRRHSKAFAADAAVMSDMPILGPDRPAITYSMRGALSVELEVRGLRNDLHSGNFGGAVRNPLQVVCDVSAALLGADGRIQVPGFYDRVRECSPRERAYMRRYGPSDAEVLQNAGAERGWGERGFTFYERLTIRPSLTLNGIVGGYQGDGGKAVIPAHATGKFNFRLVPDQDPHEIEALFREHIARITPSAVHSQVRGIAYAKPALVPRDHPAIRAAAIAYRRGFDAKPVFLRVGGSLPVVNSFQEILGIPTVLMGFALPDDRLHGPNEKFHLPNFFNGIATSIFFLQEMGEVLLEGSTERTGASGRLEALAR